MGPNEKGSLIAHQVDEDEIVLDAFVELSREIPDLLLILAPRQPGRFDEVAAKLLDRGLNFERRSGKGSCALAQTPIAGRSSSRHDGRVGSNLLACRRCIRRRFDRSSGRPQHHRACCCGRCRDRRPAHAELCLDHERLPRGEAQSSRSKTRRIWSRSFALCCSIAILRKRSAGGPSIWSEVNPEYRLESSTICCRPHLLGAVPKASDTRSSVDPLGFGLALESGWHVEAEPLRTVCLLCTAVRGAQ